MWSHNSRVGSISWNPLQTDFLSSGSQAGHIHHYDIRMAHYHTHSLSKAHTLDVCGLKWSPNGRFMASGGNDNLVNVWDLYGKDSWSAPLHTIKDHTAAIKVLNLPSLRHLTVINISGSSMESLEDKSSCNWRRFSRQDHSSMECIEWYISGIHTSRLASKINVITLCQQLLQLHYNNNY